MYFENDALTFLSLPYDVVLTASANGLLLGTFFAPAGTAFSDATKWSSPFATDLADNFSGATVNATAADFAKLTFASLQGWTYSKARVIQLKIQALKDGEFSQNSGPFLFMGKNTSTGSLYANNMIDIADGFLYIGNFIGQVLQNQGLVNIELNGNSQQSKQNFISDMASFSIPQGGIQMRTFADTESPTGLSVFWSARSDAAIVRQNLNRSFITGYDVDGFPNYGTPVDVGAIGAIGPDNTATSSPSVNPVYSANGMPLLVISKGRAFGTWYGSILANTGTAAAPNYSAFLPFLNIGGGIDNELRQGRLIRNDSNGSMYVATYNFLTTSNFLSRLDYSGANGDPVALTTDINWSRHRMGASSANSPATNGTGATATFTGQGIDIDETLIVNGEPTIFMSDDTNHVLWQITRNLSAFGDERDYDFLIIVGQTGIATNVDGDGTAATLNNPQDLVINNGFIYLNCQGARTVRKIATTAPLFSHYIFWHRWGWS